MARCIINHNLLRTVRLPYTCIQSTGQYNYILGGGTKIDKYFSLKNYQTSFAPVCGPDPKRTGISFGEEHIYT